MNGDVEEIGEARRSGRPKLRGRGKWSQNRRLEFTLRAGHRGWLVALALLLGVGIHPRRGAAQDPDHPDLGVTPDSIVLTDRARSATLTLTNPRDKDVLEIWLAPECPAGDYTSINATWFYPWLVPLDPLTAAQRYESGCAAFWVTGYPRHVTLAPHERRVIPIQIAPPKTLPNGRYTMRLIWAIWAGVGNHQGIEHYEVAVTYLRGPWQRRRWQPAPPAGRGSGVVEATPAMLVLDDSTRTTTFTLHNRAATPTEVWLAIDCPWFMVNFAGFPLSHQYESAWHGRSANASAMLGGFPQHLVLAPHERRTLTVEYSPGLTLFTPEGDAYARIRYAETPVLLRTPTGEPAFTTPGGEITVVTRTVTRDPATHQLVGPRLTLAPPRLQKDRQARPIVCDTVRQPGLGFVMTLQATLADAAGKPVPAAPTAQRAWALDTTVAVWEVKRSRLMRIGDEQPHDPEPVCFALPHVAPGQYQLVLSAYELEDVARQHPVRGTFPLAIP